MAFSGNFSHDLWAENECVLIIKSIGNSIKYFTIVFFFCLCFVEFSYTTICKKKKHETSEYIRCLDRVIIKLVVELITIK